MVSRTSAWQEAWPPLQTAAISGAAWLHFIKDVHARVWGMFVANVEARSVPCRWKTALGWKVFVSPACSPM